MFFHGLFGKSQAKYIGVVIRENRPDVFKSQHSTAAVRDGPLSLQLIVSSICVLKK